MLLYDNFMITNVATKSIQHVQKCILNLREFELEAGFRSDCVLVRFTLLKSDRHTIKPLCDSHTEN